MAPLLFLLQTPLHLSQANTSRSMMEAGRPGELHKKRLSRFDRRNLLKRYDLRGSLCHRRQGFKHVGTWPHAMEAGPKVIDVYWMTLSRAAWGSRSEAAGQ